jgi:flagellar biosynthesis chaperone FliJ
LVVSKALRVVARLRKLAIDEARRELAARLAAEARAAEADRTAQASLRREHQAALALGAEDAAIGAFATWLPRGLEARNVARDASARAQEAAQEGRAVLATARASAEAVAQMLARLAAERLAEANRREQAVLDEVGQRRLAEWRRCSRGRDIVSSGSPAPRA